MEYAVLVERKNEIWCAIIPTLSDLSAKGASYEEAVQNALALSGVGLSKLHQATLVTQRVECPVHGDPVEPGGEGAIRVKAIQ